MNRSEFDKTVKALGISIIADNYEIYDNNLGIEAKICFSTSLNGAVISGIIPLEVANIIHEKYPGNQYGIRIDSECPDNIPSECATDDIYERKIQEYASKDLSPKEFLSKCNNTRRNLKRRIDKNKYIKKYHIDTKEGLVILITEMRDYFARINRKAETEVKRYNEIISIINSMIINEINPNMTAEEWMVNNESYSKFYYETLARDMETTLGRLFREAISDFDNAVNPFQDINNKLTSVNIYSSNVMINGYSNEKGNTRMIITDIDTENFVDYQRSDDGFCYGLHYSFGKKDYLQISHYFTGNCDDSADRGEGIAIYYGGKNSNNKQDIRFNITNGTIGTTRGEKKLATPGQIAFIYDELLKAIEYASSVTIDNMSNTITTYMKKVLRNKEKRTGEK